MKKILIFVTTFLLIFSLAGCSKKTEEKLYKDLKKKVENSKGYEIEGKLELVNNEDVYNYDVIVNYKKDNFYKKPIDKISIV